MADRTLGHALHHCSCRDCCRDSRGEVAQDHAAINRVLVTLDERQRRLFAGLLARGRGHGGVTYMARVTGLSRTTIGRGVLELRAGAETGDRRLRRLGGGRPCAQKNSRDW